jgi:hypothetical protein
MSTTETVEGTLDDLDQCLALLNDFNTKIKIASKGSLQDFHVEIKKILSEIYRCKYSELNTSTQLLFRELIISCSTEVLLQKLKKAPNISTNNSIHHSHHHFICVH